MTHWTARRRAAVALTAAVTAGVAVLVPLGATGGAAPTDDPTSGTTDTLDPTIPPGLETTTTIDGDPTDDPIGTVSTLLDTPSSTTTSTSSSTTATTTATTTTRMPAEPRQGSGSDSAGPKGGKGAVDPGPAAAAPAVGSEPAQGLPAPVRGVPLDPERLLPGWRSPMAADAAAGFVTMPAGTYDTFRHFDLFERLDLTGEQVRRLLAPFPVAGRATWSNDWHAFRFGPGPVVRLHQGVDIFAAKRTPVIASASGVVGNMTTTALLGGVSLRLTVPTDGTYFYYAHLDRFAPGLEEGDRVREGDVLGFVGNTGNAVGTPPHLHYEIHPDGGEAVSPLPYLERWLNAALRELVGLAGVEPATLNLLPAAPMTVAPEQTAIPFLATPGRSGSGERYFPASPIRTAEDTAADGLVGFWLLAAAGVGFWGWRRRRRAMLLWLGG